MELLSTLNDLRRQVQKWRTAGETIALVPTMGNLHAGHLALVGEARHRADRCVVSIFVNPMQFGEGEDFSRYPRTLDRDRRMLEDAGVDLLYNPQLSEVYPHGEQAHTRVEVPGLSDILCGASRPGHFVGVTTVVCKLLNMVQADLAVFGEKDYQQLLLIRHMVADLAIATKIVGMTTIREADGLAMSSRNGYLETAERLLAPMLYQTLHALKSEIEAGMTDIAKLEAQAREHLRAVGFRPDYLSVRRAVDLAPPDASDQDLVILAAAHLGRARLIDNLPFRRNPALPTSA